MTSDEDRIGEIERVLLDEAQREVWYEDTRTHGWKASALPIGSRVGVIVGPFMGTGATKRVAARLAASEIGVAGQAPPCEESPAGADPIRGGTMAVVMQLVFEGVGLPDYIKANAQVIDDEPDGLLFHSAGEGPEGLTIIDIWESSAAYEAFFAATLQGAIAGSGLADVRPQVESWELGNVWVPDGEALAAMSNFGMR